MARAPQRRCSSRLLLVDFADVVFAVDSIPAIFAVTQDPFIVFTSNAFAILGLRSLYFAIAGMMMMFKYLKFSLIFILGFVGVKMMLHHHFEISHTDSLGRHRWLPRDRRHRLVVGDATRSNRRDRARDQTGVVAAENDETMRCQAPALRSFRGDSDV